MTDEEVTIRACRTIEEYERMVDLEIEVWKFTDRDVVPSQMYVVALRSADRRWPHSSGGRWRDLFLPTLEFAMASRTFILTWPRCCQSSAILGLAGS